MGLPEDGTAWPPADSAAVYFKMAEWAAWYSGEPDRLIDVYAGNPGSSTGGTSTNRVAWWRFWSRARAGQDGNQRALLHVPIAGDLAAVSGSLLFGEAPKLRVRKDRAGLDDLKLGDDAPDGPPASTPEEETQARLLEIAEKGGLFSRLVEAAESAAALGGVYIYPVWDKNLRDVPIMAIAQADSAVPTFKWGILTAVTFWRVVARDGNRIWRHIETHEMMAGKAIVLNGLYVGGTNDLGASRPLDASPETHGLEPVVELPLTQLDVQYIPNIRPNRLWRSRSEGVADISGAETLLDGLDEVYASWMRDIRLAKARILVPREYLQKDADGASGFDVDQEIYVPMDMEPGLSQDSRAMMAHQFKIRYLEHRETSVNLIDRIVSNAGYVPQTLGEGTIKGIDGSGTALRISEHKTLLTLRKKGNWWKLAIENLLEAMLLIDNEVFKTGVDVIRPTVTVSDSIIDNPLELAQTALALKTAEASSTESRVRLVNPDWSEAEILAEMERIKDDSPPVEVSGFGNPEEDPASTSKLPITDQTKGPAPTNAPPPSPPQAKAVK